MPRIVAQREIDLGWHDALRAGDLLDGKEVAAGYQSSDVYADGTAVTSVAYWLEYGTEDMDPKAFMRRAFDGPLYMERSASFFERMQKRDGYTLVDVLDDLGQLMVDDIQLEIQVQGLIQSGKLLRSTDSWVDPV